MLGRLKSLAWFLASLIPLLGVPVAAAEALTARLGAYRFPDELASELKLPPVGAPLYGIIPQSSAGKAGLQPGDVVTALDGVAVKDFGHLASLIRSRTPGSEVELEILRSAAPISIKATLSAWAGELNEDAHRRTLAYLRGLLAKHEGPTLRREIISELWQSGARVETLAEIEKAIQTYPDDVDFVVRRLDTLQRTGDYELFVEQAIAQAEKRPNDRGLQTIKAEALMANGQLAEAADISARVAAQSVGFPARFNHAVAENMHRWSVARLRLGQSLNDPRVGSFIERAEWVGPDMGTLQYWRVALAGRAPYEIVSDVTATEVDFQESGVLFGLVPYKMHGIPIEINGVRVDMAIVDTGASHTLLSTQTAAAAGVDIADSAGSKAAGSLAFTAKAGFIRELKIGSIVLRNVPVNVGNPPPLVMTKARAALGIDLMHHLRFTIDYASAKVKVEPAWTTQPERLRNPGNVWDIPLWTFSDHTLTQGEIGPGKYARTLIDSGNFAYTLVWPTWAKENIPNHPGSTGSMLLYAFTNPHQDIRGLKLGGRTLPHWPAMDMPPVTLQGIDLLDVLMGHDLLSQYRVTVDMQNRRLRLESPTGVFAPPTPPNPLGVQKQ